MWLLYQLGLALLLLVAGPVLLLRKGRHYLPTLAGRLTRALPAGPRGALWVHAVSVGEVNVAATLAAALPAAQPLLVTTITPTGQERARRLFAGRATVAYLPFDLGPPLARFLARFSPGALILVEGDYWPLLLARCRRLGVPVAVVNGRVGDRTFRRLGRWPALARPLLGSVARFGVQTAEDARRLAALGVAPERLAVTGNLKYEAAAPPPLPAVEREVERLAAGRPLLVAGSTMPGEEGLVLDAFAVAGGGARAMLLLAPRHPERFDEVARLLAARDLSWIRRSQVHAEPAAAPGTPPAVLLLDSLGELAALYRLATACFVGGTLVPTGGHNPLEPARFGRPIAVGPSMENFRDMAEQFDGAGGWRRVGDARELGGAWGAWLTDPGEAAHVGAAAQRLVAANQGSLQRTLELLAPLLPIPAARPAAAGAGA
jgi:3-deoxy-D-manno-octulosonic-acid transferase